MIGVSEEEKRLNGTATSTEMFKQIIQLLPEIRLEFQLEEQNRTR